MTSRCVKQILAALVVTGAASLPMTAGAQEDEGKLTDTSCRDVMILSGADRDTTIAFFHGYLIGKLGKTTVDLDKLTDSTEAFLNACLDNPKAKAVATLEALVAK